MSGQLCPSGINSVDAPCEMSGCGTWCSGLAGKVVIGQRLNSILEVFSSLNDLVALKVLSKVINCYLSSA